MNQLLIKGRLYPIIRAKGLKHGVLVILCLLFNVPAGHAQSNILANPSFEEGIFVTPLLRGCRLDDLSGWHFPFAGVERCAQYCPNGLMVAKFSHFISQHVETIPGRRYYFRFATQTDGISVQFGDQLVNTLTNMGGTNYYYNQPWFYSYCHFTATSNLTLLSFFSTQSVTVDDVLLGWLDEPLRLVHHPVDADAMQSGSVAFQVKADGGPPISYQWYKGQTPLPGATNALLFLTNVQPALAGSYHAVASNPINSVTSNPALLSVDTVPRAPQIVLWPEDHDLLQDSHITLRAGAIGTPPLRYQWRLNGTNLPGATDSILPLIPLQPAHAGIYEVMVENDHGSTLSLPSTVSIRPSGTLGRITFASPLSVRRPIFDVDGVTMLTGPNFRCQVYTGPSPDRLTAVSTSQVIRTSPAGTYAFNLIYVTLPGTAAESENGVEMLVQVRAWEAAFGSSYELARAQGGKVGVSPTTLHLVQPYWAVPQTVSVLSFALRAGQPGFSTGRISRGEAGLDPIEWILKGAPGYTYVVEKRAPPNHWSPLIILSNATGTATFTDPEQQNSSLKFYRARMLD